jgi:myo-inositol-1(or 4)-monophosphatase
LPSRAADRALLEEAVRAAGALALTYYGAALRVWDKSHNHPVSEADLAVNALLHERLAQERPAYGWLSEETADDPAARDRASVWVVDPIDGTRAFIKTRPAWCISVALVEAGASVLGAVFNPVTQEFFFAEEGGGAHLNGAPISASSTAALEDCAMLGDAQMFGHPAWARPWPAMRVESRNAVAYRLALVAAGRFDAALALSSKADWDLAAGALILAEAGGVASDHAGKPFVFAGETPQQPSVAAAGPHLHPLIIERTRHIRLP